VTLGEHIVDPSDVQLPRQRRVGQRSDVARTEPEEPDTVESGQQLVADRERVALELVGPGDAPARP
jgi:hypothetical protein